MYTAGAVRGGGGRVVPGFILCTVVFLFTQFSLFAASVTLAWNPSADPTVAGYNLYYGGASGSYTNGLSAGPATNVTISGLTPGATYYFAATTYSSAGLESTFSGEISYQVPANAPTTNQPPTLNPIGNVTVNENAGPQTIGLSGITSGSTNPTQTLVVTAFSSNPGLIPNPTVNYLSPNTTGSLTFTPVANASGTATITVQVNNGGASNNLVTQTFTVTVNPVNSPPTLNPISNVTLVENAKPYTVVLNGISAGITSGTPTITVTAGSSNPGLISNPTVSYTSPRTSGSLSLQTAHNATGTAVITVTVNNGQPQNNTVSQTFTVTVTASTAAFNRSGGKTRNQLLLSAPLANTVALVGQTKTLSVQVSGAGRLKYQWKLNGVVLRGASGPRLTLRNIRTNQAGVYSVTISNETGSTNSMAQLTVLTSPAAQLTPATHANGQYAMTVAGVTGYKYVVEASSDLVHWTPVQTNTAPFVFVDANASQFPQRFYRSVYAP